VAERCRQTYRTIRRDIIELVLATDMNRHFEQLERFKHYLPGLIQYYNAQVTSSVYSVSAQKVDPGINTGS